MVYCYACIIILCSELNCCVDYSEVLRNGKLVSRDVQSRYLNLGSVSVCFFLNSDSVWDELGWVKKMPFGFDIMVICYSCNGKYYSDSG